MNHLSIPILVGSLLLLTSRAEARLASIEVSLAQVDASAPEGAPASGFVPAIARDSAVSDEREPAAVTPPRAVKRSQGAVQLSAENAGRAEPVRRWRATLVGGSVLSSSQLKIEGTWKHQSFESPAIRGSLAYLVSRNRKTGMYLLMGTDLVYTRSLQRISSSRASTEIKSQNAMAGITISATYEPPQLDRRFGVGVFAGTGFYLMRESRLQSPGYSAELTSPPGPIFLPLWFGTDVWYRPMEEWKIILGWLAAEGTSSITTGVGYEF